MPVHGSTAALKAELEAPTTTRATVGAAIQAQRAAMLALCRQAERYEELLTVVVENETDSAVAGKLPSLHQQWASWRKRCAELDEDFYRLSTALRHFEGEQLPDILAAITEAEAR